MKKINILDFPPDLRELMSLPFGSDQSMYEEVFKELTSSQLQMALMIMDMKYVGMQIDKRRRIQAEINRRIQKQQKLKPRDPRLPREDHWLADFNILWEQACEPFRRLRR